MRQFPQPTNPRLTRADVLIEYLDFFRDGVIQKIAALTEAQARVSELPSGWSPLELLNHLTHVERRWLVWGFEGTTRGDPWGDQVDGRWQVPAGWSRADVIARARGQARVSRDIVRAHDLYDVGAPSERWEGADPPTLERVLLHLVQEFARHLGQLDIVVELAGGPEGE